MKMCFSLGAICRSTELTEEPPKNLPSLLSRAPLTFFSSLSRADSSWLPVPSLFANSMKLGNRLLSLHNMATCEEYAPVNALPSHTFVAENQHDYYRISRLATHGGFSSSGLPNFGSGNLSSKYGMILSLSYCSISIKRSYYYYTLLDSAHTIHDSQLQLACFWKRF